MTDLSRRIDYDVGVLDEETALDDPVEQLRVWLADAEASGAPEPNSLVLSTVDPTGRPSARNLLLRDLDDEGHLVVHTNRRSHKGADIAGNPNVCVLFSWLGLLRQVRVQGIAEPASDAVSDAYFASRPRGSQIGAWASDQSTVLADRAELERAVAEVEARFEGVDVPRPPHWGGYSIRATEFEFWQGRRSRLHDRLHYSRHGATWRIQRLSP